MTQAGQYIHEYGDAGHGRGMLKITNVDTWHDEEYISLDNGNTWSKSENFTIYDPPKYEVGQKIWVRWNGGHFTYWHAKGDLSRPIIVEVIEVISHYYGGWQYQVCVPGKNDNKIKHHYKYMLGGFMDKSILGVAE